MGNAWRGDDGAGHAVARAARARAAAGVTVLELELVPPDLFERWTPAARVVLVDAARSGAPPGTVHRCDARAAPLPAELRRVSTHGGGLAEAIELARALDRLPAALLVYALEGARFDPGTGLGPEVAAVVEDAAARALAELARLIAPG